MELTERKKSVTVTINNKILAKAREQAKRERRSLSSLVEFLIDKNGDLKNL